MSIVEQIKRLLGLDSGKRAEAEGSDVTVHLEHPGMEDTEPNADTADLEDIKGIGPTYGERLRENGIESVHELANAEVETLAERSGISETRLATWIERARIHVEGS